MEILLVEDNIHDIIFISNALQQSTLNSNLHVAKDGQECLDFIFKNGSHANAPKPDLIILDISMPNLNGIEVLKNLKSHKYFRLIPVVILTSSSNKLDIENAYENYANNYVLKPTDAKNYFNSVREIEKFWALFSEIP